MIIGEYLRWFDVKVRIWKILLRLDGFSGHELGFELGRGLEGLDNNQIAWLSTQYNFSQATSSPKYFCYVQAILAKATDCIYTQPTRRQ